MRFDTKTAADYAVQKLDLLIERAARDTAEAVQQNDIPTAVTWFHQFRETVRDLQSRMSILQAHVDGLSQEVLPTMFTNQSVKTIKVDDVGRVTINNRWSASMIDKQAGMDWLRATGNEGLIIETVNAQTLGAFGKDRATEGKPLPSDVFKVTATPYTSVTKV